MDRWPLGVFASVDAGLGVQLKVAAELGVTTVQLHAPHRSLRTPQRADEFLDQLAELGLRITVVFGGFDGESYADIPTTARTVGLVPPATRAARLQEMKEIADFSRRLGVSAVGLHLGFVPHDDHDPMYGQVVTVTRELCDHCRGNSQFVHLETGQESADELLQFLASVARDNLVVNFDPANMILYGIGEPIAALEKLGSHVRSVHCKDAKWAAHPGKEWGTEVPLGDGDVGLENFLKALQKIGYTGPLTIEREIPQDPARQKAEIGQAIGRLNELKLRLPASV
jgi:sugar phosphate isomerase/epimerase